jgi:multidrug efflux system membrane fusion protein
VVDIAQGRGQGLRPGDMVAQGAVLARLRQQDYDNPVTQAQSQREAAAEAQRAAQAQLAQATASRVKAAADFARAQGLIDSKSITRPEFDSARAQMDVAEAQVAAARAQLDNAAAQVRNADAGLASAKLAHQDTALVAPFDATVVERNVEVGSLTGPSVPAYTLAEIGTVKAVLGVPDTVVVGLQRGKSIGLTVEALPGQEFHGTVSAVAAVAQSDTRLFPVEVTLPNPRQLLKPGMIAALTLADGGPAPEIPVVPLSAVVRDPRDPAGFVVMTVDGNVARARRVTLGPSFGDVLAVSAGVKPGERVIREGAPYVTDGEAVEVLP